MHLLNNLKINNIDAEILMQIYDCHWEMLESEFREGKNLGLLHL